MKRQYQIDKQRAVQQFRRIAIQQNPNIQMILPLADIVGMFEQGVGNLLRETGLALMQTGSPAVGRGSARATRRPPRASVGQRGWLLRGGRAEGADP